MTLLGALCLFCLHHVLCCAIYQYCTWWLCIVTDEEQHLARNICAKKPQNTQICLFICWFTENEVLCGTFTNMGGNHYKGGEDGSSTAMARIVGPNTIDSSISYTANN